MTVISDLIRHDKPLRTGAMAAYPYSAKLEAQYRFVSRFDEPVLLHQVQGKEILIPRALCPLGKEDVRDAGMPVLFPKTPTLRPDQEDWIPATAHYLLSGHSGITEAGTGRGKTVAGFYAAAALGVKTLVITTKDDIYKQWIDGAQKFLGLEYHEVGEIRQDKCEVVGTKFVVAMIHSLSSGKYPEWITKDFGLVIFDEVHRVAAEQFSVVAAMFPAKLRLGLSADHRRSDGKELLIQAHIGPVRVKAEAELQVPRILVRKSNWECPRRFKTNKMGQKVVTRIPHEPGKTVHVEKMLAADNERNHMIAQDILDVYEKGRKVVIFSTLTDHLKTLHRAVQQLGVTGRDMGFYSQASTIREREEREKVKGRPIIFTTFAMMAEGTDIPWLDTCVLAMPRSNVVQPVGRVRREHPDKQFPAVIDYVDEDSPVFLGYSKNRRRWYSSIGAEIIDV